MKTIRWMLAGLVAGIIVVAFRDFERRRWLAPALPQRQETDEREPLLGYDGMDQETLIDWLSESSLDAGTIEEIIRYEEAHLRREPVLELLEELQD